MPRVSTRRHLVPTPRACWPHACMRRPHPGPLNITICSVLRLVKPVYHCKSHPQVHQITAHSNLEHFMHVRREIQPSTIGTFLSLMEHMTTLSYFESCEQFQEPRLNFKFRGPLCALGISKVVSLHLTCFIFW